MTLKSGKLIEKFSFDKRVDVSDGAGNFVASWIEQHGPVAASILFMRGGESVTASRLEGVKPAIISIRDCVGARQISTDWRARDNRSGKIYNIRDITPAQRNGIIELMCQSGVADG